VAYRSTWVGQSNGATVIHDGGAADTGAPGASGSLNNVVVAFEDLLPSRQPLRFFAEYPCQTSIFFKRRHPYTLPDNGFLEADYRTGAHPVSVDEPPPAEGKVLLTVTRAGNRWRFTARGDGAGPASLDLFDVRGRVIRRLADGAALQGEAGLEWDGRSDDGVRVASGVYFARLRLGEATATKRVHVIW
jgi:hypothetical protein